MDLEIDSFITKGEEIRIDDIQKAGVIIQKSWEKFWSKHNFNELKEMPRAYYFNYEKDETKPYSFLIGLSKESINTASVKELIVPKQKYVVFENQGKMPDILMDTWKEIWNSKKIKRSFLVDFEEYPNPNKVKIHIGVRE